MKKNVLFICTENAARSQMAEAILKNKAGNLFDVYSAGTSPEPIDQRALSILKKYGVNTETLYNKSIQDISDKTFDYVITLCHRAEQECKASTFAKTQYAWDFSDPKTRKGLEPFAQTFNELNRRIEMFLTIESDQFTRTPNLASQCIENDKNQIDLIEFYKCLTDDIRLKTLLLASYFGELCVCELMVALKEQSQPKVSRNLALLKKANVLTSRKHGQWVFYRINHKLPEWAKSVLSITAENNVNHIRENILRVSNMAERPDKNKFCC